MATAADAECIHDYKTMFDMLSDLLFKSYTG